MGIKQLEVQLGASVLLGCQAIMFEISHKFQSAHCASSSARWAALREHYVRQNFRCRSLHIEAARNPWKRFRAPGRKKKELTRTSVQTKSVPR